jgi:hypothetical protein
MIKVQCCRIYITYGLRFAGSKGGYIWTHQQGFASYLYLCSAGHKTSSYITMPTDCKSKWGVEPRPHSLSTESFQALLEGTVPYIHVPALISQDVSAKLEQELLPRITPYLHAVGPRLLKVGVAQFEFQALSQSDLIDRSSDSKHDLH